MGSDAFLRSAAAIGPEWIVVFLLVAIVLFVAVVVRAFMRGRRGE
jgi:hypothetical protein